MKRVALLQVILCIVVMLTVSTPARAQVSLTLGDLGLTSFEDGLAGPGWLLEQYVGYSNAGQMMDKNGNKVVGRNTVSATDTDEHIAYCTGKRLLLGGLYCVDAHLPFVDVAVNTPVTGALSGHGLTDIAVSPFGITWAPKKIAGRDFFNRCFVLVSFPTGKYNDTNPFTPTSSHAYSVTAVHTWTYYLTKNHKWEVTDRNHWAWTGENDHPFVGYGFKSTQPGQALYENYATSYAVTNNIRVGINAYAAQQITDHKINGINVPGSRERIFGQGPGVQFGGRGTWFYINSYFESGAKNFQQGTRVYFRVEKVLGMPKHG